jgi:hypothetical protein
MPSGTPTSFGRYHAPEPPHHITLIHRHSGSSLKVVDHEPKLAVLDQEDLINQDIDTSVLVSGAQKVDALGSCTANAFTVAASNLGLATYLELVKAVGLATPDPTVGFSDTKTGEETAIRFYHLCTDQTGDPSQEWPATDCGSTGVFVVKEAQRLGVVKSQKIAVTPQDLASLLQTGGVIQGTPFFNAWMTPDRDAFVDGLGSQADLEAAIHSGIAGGHETHISAIERIQLSATGQVIPDRTVLRVRNSWSDTWGDDGSFRIHLSTLAMLGSYCDFRQLAA